MKKFTVNQSRQGLVKLCLLFISFAIIFWGCRKISIDKDDLRNFQQVNIVANSSLYSPILVDPTMQNAWGLAWSPGGIAWVNSHDGHVSGLYTTAGIAPRPPVNIPSPTDAIGGEPTGIVFAGGAGFKLSNNQPAAFLFVGEDGVLSGWNGPAGNNAIRIANNSATAHYTGLALTTWNGSHFLYAANFMAARIDVWDTTFTSVSLPFHDPFLPSGYAPFNIQAVGYWLFVMYAKVAPDGDEQAGANLGFVDVFNPDGSFVKRFASKGPLNAPWGVTMTPAGFIGDEDMSDESGKIEKNGNDKGKSHGHDDIDNQPVILVGNFGDGKINVYSVDGQFLGQLHAHNKTIVIEKLWALSFEPSTAADFNPKRLFFTAGPNDEMDGVFGYLIKN